MINEINNKMKINDQNYNYNDLAINVYNYCDNLSQKKFNKNNFEYWFKTPKFNYWI